MEIKKTWKEKGFTMAELLIVVAIIAVLAAIAIPIFNAQLEKSREGTDADTLRNAYAKAALAALDEKTPTDDPLIASVSVSGDTKTVATKSVVKFEQTQDNWTELGAFEIGGLQICDGENTAALAGISEAGPLTVTYEFVKDSLNKITISAGNDPIGQYSRAS